MKKFIIEPQTEKEKKLKDAFAVLGILLIGLIVYWYVTGGPFSAL